MPRSNLSRGFVLSLALAATPYALAARQQAPAAPAARPPFSVVEQSIFGLQNAMEDGRATSRQLVEQYLARIEKYDKNGPAINAFIALNPRALDVAAALDAERRAGKVRGPLHGIPIVVKDNYATEDLPTTAGSASLAGFKTGSDAFMVKKLRDAGAVIIGKTNLHELAYGITSISSQGGQTRNPYDPTRNPGGSSGGTGAAVAANFAAAGMGTDTCGSIRNPSSSNNLFGIRGTQGLSSRSGIVPLSHSQDIGGPLARTVTDLAIMLDATVGADPTDPVSASGTGHIPNTYLAVFGDSGIADVSIGVFNALFGNAPEDAEVGRVVRAALDNIGVIGANMKPVAIPDYDAVMGGTSVINAEFKFDLMDYLAKYPGAPMKSLAEIIASGKYHQAIDGVIKRAEQVTSRNSESYQAALAKREQARDAIIAAMRMQGVTMLAYPTLRRKPALIGEGQGGSNCQLSATTGLPAMSIPAGFTDDGVPVGLELLGLPWTEPQLLKVAFAYERVMRPRKPPKTTP